MKQRELIHEAEYDDDVRELDRIDRSDRALMILTHLIACDPTTFPFVKDSDVPGLRVATGHGIGGVPAIDVFYLEQDSETVRLLAAVAYGEETEELF